MFKRLAYSYIIMIKCPSKLVFASYVPIEIGKFMYYATGEFMKRAREMSSQLFVVGHEGQLEVYTWIPGGYVDYMDSGGYVDCSAGTTRSCRT